MQRLTAKQFVGQLKKIVADHNAKYGNEDYLLLVPPAKAVGKELIAMPWIGAPTIYGLFPSQGQGEDKKGRAFSAKI